MKIISKNKPVFFNYEITDRFEAGIVLLGHEVKSIKTGNINIKDSIVKLYDGEWYVTNIDIPLYKKTPANLAPHYEPKGKRKLLLKKREVSKLAERTTKTGLVLVVLSIYINRRGFIKLELGLGKLKKKVEKKQAIKERDISRQADKEIKSFKF
ncbi:MAG: SsrA-binding protein SmpB [Candidatus Absconditabacteria bacterium]